MEDVSELSLLCSRLSGTLTKAVPETLLNDTPVTGFSHSASPKLLGKPVSKSR
jgi:hypothetical protein